MLVLTRKKNEMIQIGNEVIIKVISTGRGKVKLGIQAPADVRVLRAELAGRVRRQPPPDAECPTEQPQVFA